MLMQATLLAMFVVRLEYRKVVMPLMLLTAIECCSGVVDLMRLSTWWKPVTFVVVSAPTGFVETVPMWMFLGLR